MALMALALSIHILFNVSIWAKAIVTNYIQDAHCTGNITNVIHMTYLGAVPQEITVAGLVLKLEWRQTSELEVHSMNGSITKCMKNINVGIINFDYQYIFHPFNQKMAHTGYVHKIGSCWPYQRLGLSLAKRPSSCLPLWPGMSFKNHWICRSLSH